MDIDYAAISKLFRRADIDGLIASGAPDDEYEPEVDRIAAAIEDLPRDQASVAAIAEIFATVWAQMCGGSQEQMKRRRVEFDEIAEKVMRFWA
jgi:hypothetical protein